ncbi:hypothetical protein BKA83DRAFT_582699 [Pisolithus microcarpus]|nr:hypothetical protein BKA83DRAFT_582699 [Pisolithus microcarpus]
MTSYHSHLTVLEQSAALYPSAFAFRVPISDPLTGRVHDWLPISYQQFKEDVEVTARHWCGVFRAQGIPHGSVIGLWLSGIDYQDVLHIYGISRAGYVPQLFSIRLPNPDVVHELLREANARTLIFASEFAASTASFSVPVYPAVHKRDMGVNSATLPPLASSAEGNDVVFIFHTSGSTSGRPKLVPCNRRWLHSVVDKARITTAPQDPQRWDVTVTIESHLAATSLTGYATVLIGSLQHGTCTVQATKQGFSSEELLDMIQRCGLNRLNQFSTFLSIHLRNSRQNPKLLQALRHLDQVLYSGLPLDRDDEDWAYTNGLKMKNLFGSTECGAMLLSIGGTSRDARFLRPLPGTSYKFVPIDRDPDSEDTHQSSIQLLELVILAESGDCPDTSLRTDDGHFHTGDLFQETTPGAYVFRGRNDDWIKSESSLRCDTKAIEDNVRSTCGDLIGECIVVGTGRPSPALFVEPAAGVDHERLQREILRKTRAFHSRRYLHERITRKELVIIVPPKSLPRTSTKGNVRPRLDDIYSSLN